MTNLPDTSDLTPAQLIDLKASIEARLEEAKQRHLEEAKALGLTLVDGNNAPKRKRRNTQNHAEPNETD